MSDRNVKLAFIAIQNVINDKAKTPIRAFRDIRAICESQLDILFHDWRLNETGRKKGTPNKASRKAGER